MEYLNSLTGKIFSTTLCIAWLMGIVMAKGFWLTALSICLPFYAWYLLVEELMITIGFGV